MRNLSKYMMPKHVETQSEFNEWKWYDMHQCEVQAEFYVVLATLALSH